MDLLRCMLLVFLFGGCPFFLPGQAPSPSKHKDLERELNKIVHYDAQVNYERSPGFIVGVIWGDDTFLFPFGTLVDSLQPPQNRQFELGAVSQLLTAELIRRELASGHLQLDSPVGTFMPELAGEEQLTIRSLLTHGSGISPSPLGLGHAEESLANPYGKIGKEELLQFFQDRNPEVEGYQYSLFNFALLGILLEELNGQPLEQQYQAILPGIWLQVPPLLPDSLWVPGYERGGRPTPPWQVDACKGANGLAVDAQSMLRLLQHWLAVAVGFPDYYRGQAPTGIRKNTLVAYGWHVLKKKKFPEILLHTGATSGHRAFVAMVPETQTGVFVLSNSPYGLGGVGLLTLRMLNNNWKL